MENLEKNLNSNIDHIKKLYFWRSAFFGLIILAAGIAIGGASMSIFVSNQNTETPTAPGYNNLMPRLVQVLGLRQQQINKIRPILDKHMQHLNEIREDARVEIANTLDQMNKEINPILGEMQRNVWSTELLRIQRQFNPEPARGRGIRRGAAQPGQGAGIRAGRAGQRVGARRGFEPQPPPPGAPNVPSNNINENDSIPEVLEPVDINQ